MAFPATAGVCTHNKRYIDIPCFPEGNNSSAQCAAGQKLQPSPSSPAEAFWSAAAVAAVAASSVAAGGRRI